MGRALDDVCTAAIRRAVEIAELALRGNYSEAEAASAISRLATFDCYDFLNEGFNLVDLMAGFTASVYTLEQLKPDDQLKADISRTIRHELAEFLAQAKP